MPRATIRFYAELRDYVDTPSGSMVVSFSGDVTVGDLIDACGVPGDLVDLVLIDGRSGGLDDPVAGGARMSVYPVFESFDVGPVAQVRNTPLRVTKFLADDSLAGLARCLRCMGFDTGLHSGPPAELVRASLRDRRILLTSHSDALADRALTHATRVAPGRPSWRLRHLMERFHLGPQARPFTRCPECNEELPGAEPRRCRKCGGDWAAVFHDPRLRRVAARMTRS